MVSVKCLSNVRDAGVLQLHLGSVGHRVPVSSGQAEVAVSYPAEDLVGSVLRAVGEGCKSVGFERDEWRSQNEE